MINEMPRLIQFGPNGRAAAPDSTPFAARYFFSP
jgi:hypothetical protein